MAVYGHQFPGILQIPLAFFFFFLNLCSKGIRTVPDAGDNWKEEWGKFCDNPHPDK